MLSACSNSKPTCSLDPQKLTGWEEWTNLPQPEKENYTTRYQACGKHITFVAVAHSNDPKSETYDEVVAAFKGFHPEIVIAEGFPTQMGTSPREMIEYATQAKGTLGDFEALLTVRQAAGSNIAFIGGEPSDNFIVKEVMKHGVDTQNLFGYYILRQIDQWVQSGEINSFNDPKMDSLIDAYAQRFIEDTGVTEITLDKIDSLYEFAAWYRNTNKVPFSDSYRPEDVWPTSPDTARETNRLSDIVANARDRHLQTVMSDALSNYDRLLIVYGASHQLIHAEALEKGYGLPVK